MEYLYQFGIAISTFAITNIDDLLLLSIYFATPGINIRQVVAGQYAGVSALVLISLLGIFLGKLFPQEYLSLLGMLPLALGLKGLFHLLKNDKEDEKENVPENSIGFMQVALVTFANGGDNLGVYTPLFAVTPLHYILLYVLIFMIMIGLWCLLGYYVSRHPFVKNIFRRYSKIILPVFLIGLGLGIIFGM
ncbi:MAG: cadmium resistance transporter [Cytophagaceae bacterium]